MANSQDQNQQGQSSNEQGNEDWSQIEDQHERRRVQNRIAQRTYRARKKNEAEEASRIAQNQQAAGAAYTAPDAADMARNDNPSGLPWGSYSMKHAVEAGKAKQSQQGSQAGSSSSSTGRR